LDSTADAVGVRPAIVFIALLYNNSLAEIDVNPVPPSVTATAEFNVIFGVEPPLEANGLEAVTDETPLPEGVPQLPSPRQYVVFDAPVPEFKLPTATCTALGNDWVKDGTDDAFVANTAFIVVAICPKVLELLAYKISLAVKVFRYVALDQLGVVLLPDNGICNAVAVPLKIARAEPVL
jgi:hypothetical protein